MGTPPYLYSSESVSNSELDQVTVRPELRFLRLEASSPALSDTEAYFPMRVSMRMGVIDRLVVDVRGGWVVDGWLSQYSIPHKQSAIQLPLCSYCEIVIETWSEDFS